MQPGLGGAGLLLGHGAGLGAAAQQLGQALVAGLQAQHQHAGAVHQAFQLRHALAHGGGQGVEPGACGLGAQRAVG